MALQNDHEFLPTDVARAVFPTAFRGYDQEAVRRYLTRLAESLEHQLGVQGLEVLEDHAPNQDRFEKLEAELAEYQDQVTSLETELAETQARYEKALGETESLVEPEPIDEQQAIAWLGKETARVLESARSAAADIVANAKAKSESMTSEAEAELSEAQAQAETMRADAEAEAQARVESLTSEAEQRASTLLAEAEEQATALTSAADKRAAKVTSEAEEFASSLTSEAEELAASVTSEAEEQALALTAKASKEAAEAHERAAASVAEAEARVASAEAEARAKADQIITLAQERRRLLMAGLVEHRRAQQDEIARLVDVRSKLAVALRDAQQHLNEVVTDLEPDESQTNDEDASVGDGSEDSIEDEVERLVSELDTALPELPDLLVATRADASESKSSEKNDGRITKAAPKKKAPAKKRSSGPSAKSQSKSPARTANQTSATNAKADATKSTADATKSTADATKSTAKESSDRPSEKPAPQQAATESSDQLASLVEGFTTIDVLSELSADSPRQAPDDVNPSAVSGGGASAPRRAVDPAALQPLLVLASDPGQRVTTVSARVGTKKPDGRRGDFELEDPPSKGLPAWFSARDEAISRGGPNVRRHLRRALNDDQSDVMDRLRNGRGAITVEDLPSAQEQFGRLLGAVRHSVADVVKAGARAGGGSEVAEPTLANLCQQLAAHLTDQVRLPTVAIVAEADHDDRELILEPIRSLYRDMRNIHLPDLADDALHEAFAIGLYEAIAPGSAVRWEVDPRTDPDPVCDINRNRLELTKGEVFPSGHLRPLSLPGCRCLVVADEGDVDRS